MANPRPPALQGQPIDPTADGEQLQDYIAKISSTHGCGAEGGGPYIFPRPVSFKDGKQRQSWVTSLPAGDGPARATFSEFIRGPMGPRNTKIGLFVVPSENWVGMATDEWDAIDWHCYCITIIKPSKGQGKAIIIWDCDPAPEIIERVPYEGERDEDGKIIRLRIQQMQSMQNAFVSEFRRSKAKNSGGIWYNGQTSLQGRGRCLQFTLAKIEEWAQAGDMAFAGPDDPRIAGCVELSF